MDFISNNKIVLGAFAVVSFIGAALYFGQGQEPREIVLPIIPCESEISDFKTVFTSKIYQLKSMIQTGQFNDAQLKEVVTQIITHIQAKTRQIDREDLLKSRQLINPTNFRVYVRKLLGWLKQKQQKIEQLQQEQWQFINSLLISQEEKVKIIREVSEHVKKERIGNISSSYQRLAQIYLVTKTNYLEKSGQKLTADLVTVCQFWNKPDLQFVPAIVDLIINRNIEDYEPELIDNQPQILLAIEKFKTQLQHQIAACQQAMSHLLCKIENALQSNRYIRD